MERKRLVTAIAICIVCAGGDGNLYDSCTNALVQSCAAGCAGSQCNPIAQCISLNVCAADGNVHDSCTGALVEVCQYGCSAGQCVTASTQYWHSDRYGSMRLAAGVLCRRQCARWLHGGALAGAATAVRIIGAAISFSRNVCRSDGNLHDSCTGALVAQCRWGCSGNCNTILLTASFPVFPSNRRS